MGIEACLTVHLETKLSKRAIVQMVAVVVFLRENKAGIDTAEQQCAPALCSLWQSHDQCTFVQQTYGHVIGWHDDNGQSLSIYTQYLYTCVHARE